MMMFSSLKKLFVNTAVRLQHSFLSCVDFRFCFDISWGIHSILCTILNVRVEIIQSHPEYVNIVVRKILYKYFYC